MLPLVSKIGTESPESHNSRASFLENAGVRLVKVTAKDAGKYESTVVFTDDKSLMDEAELIVFVGNVLEYHTFYS